MLPLQLLPILDKTHIPIKRMRDLLQSRGYTPEWKIREMKEMLHIYLVCLTLYSQMRQSATWRKAQGAVLFPVILSEEKDSTLNSRWNRLVLSEHGRT